MHHLLLKMHTQRSILMCKTSEPALIGRMMSKLDHIRHQYFCFATLSQLAP